MNFLCSEEELLSSYKRCLRIGIKTSITAPLIVLNGEELERKIQRNKKLEKIIDRLKQRKDLNGKVV